MQNLVYIVKVSNPADGKVFFIGQTKNIESYLESLVTEAKSYSSSTAAGKHRELKIREILTGGTYPVMEKITSVDADDKGAIRRTKREYLQRYGLLTENMPLEKGKSIGERIQVLEDSMDDVKSDLPDDGLENYLNDFEERIAYLEGIISTLTHMMKQGKRE